MEFTRRSALTWIEFCGRVDAEAVCMSSTTRRKIDSFYSALDARFLEIDSMFAAVDQADAAAVEARALFERESTIERLEAVAAADARASAMRAAVGGKTSDDFKAGEQRRCLGGNPAAWQALADDFALIQPAAKTNLSRAEDAALAALPAAVKAGVDFLGSGDFYPSGSGEEAAWRALEPCLRSLRDARKLTLHVNSCRARCLEAAKNLPSDDRFEALCVELAEVANQVEQRK